MSGKENKLQKTCINWCNKHGLLAINIHGGGWGNKGFPDLLIFKNGRAVAVELKNGNAYTTLFPSTKLGDIVTFELLN